MSNLVGKTEKRLLKTKQRIKFEELYSHLKNEIANNCIKMDEIKDDFVCADGYNLGIKLRRIRHGYIKVTEEQIILLNELGFIWNLKDFNKEKSFDNLMQHLIPTLNKFKGDWASINEKYVCEDGYALGMKLVFIRADRIKISEEQKTKLDKLGYPWKIRATEFMFEFNDFITRLENHIKEKGGDITKITNHDICSDGYPIGMKITNLRQNNIKLTAEQREFIEKNYPWVMTQQLLVFKFEFEDFYSRLCAELLKINNNWGLIAKGYKCEDGYTLGIKITHIRNGKIKITKEQRKRLNSIGFKWEAANKFDFELFYSKLVEALNKNNGEWKKITQRYICEDGYTLGNRISCIRNGLISLTREEKQKLIDLGFKYEVKPSPKHFFEFEDFVSRLLKLYEENGKNWKAIRYSTKCEDGYPVGRKIDNIKRGYLKLTEEQHERLKEIGFPIVVMTKENLV